MQTIKGLTALLVVAAVVFAIGATNDLRSQARYAAKLHNPAEAAAAGKSAISVAGGANANVSKPGVMTANGVGRNHGATTNVTAQARRKTPRT